MSRRGAARAVLGALVLSLLTVTGAATVASAAAGDPTFEPDPQSVGSIAFYDTSGNVITGGAVSDNPLAAYYKASGNGREWGDHAFAEFLETKAIIGAAPQAATE